MPNPPLQERVFRDYCTEMTDGENSVMFPLQLTPVALMHGITEEWSNEQLAAFAWSVLHHKSFDRQDTFVQFAHAMVKELGLPVDILELYNAHNVEERALAEASRSPYRKSSAQPNESNTGKSGKSPEEPTVSMTWWDCPVCQASKGVSIGKLPGVGVPYCSNCEGQEMTRGSWAEAHKELEFLCVECDMRQSIPRIHIKLGMTCGADRCDSEMPMKLVARLT